MRATDRLYGQATFAAFAVVRVLGQIWATTRDGADLGKIGLPGGKCDPGEDPVKTASREAAEEGLHVHGKGKLVHSDMVDGQLVRWYEFDGATPLRSYKEQSRGIKAVLVDVKIITKSGYGNEFLGAKNTGKIIRKTK